MGSAGPGRPSPRVCLPAPKETRAWPSAGGAPAPGGFPGLCLSSKGHGREFSNPEGDLGCLQPGARAASLQGRAWPWSAGLALAGRPPGLQIPPEPPCAGEVVARRACGPAWAGGSEASSSRLPASGDLGRLLGREGLAAVGERDRAALLSFLSFFLQIDSHDSRVARRATRSESQHKVAIPGRRGLGGSWRLLDWPRRRAALRSGFN